MATGTIVDVVMPQMGVSVSEGTVSRWLKAEGETVEKDETLLEISTDKVDTEVPSPATGVVTKLLVEEGDTVDVGAKLAEIEVGGEGGQPVPDEQEAMAAEVPQAPPTPQAGGEQPSPPQGSNGTTSAPASTPGADYGGNGSGSTAQAAPSGGAASGGSPGRFVSPVVARIASEHGIDVSQVPGTGGGGRVTKKDIMAFIEGGGQQQQAAAPAPAPQQQAPAASQPVQPAAAATAPATAPSAPATSAAPATPPASFTGGERVVNFSPMRKAIARHMIESQATSAHVTSVIEVDMTNVVSLRSRLKGELQQSWGVKVTFTHFVVRALIDAIAAWPMINSEVRGDSAVIKSYLNLGIAVALDGGEGLIVPVVKNAEEKNLVGIARAINDLADRARTKRLSPDEVQGGTFTLTNPGVFGTVHGTPVINQPQVAILDTEAIIKRPVVLTDEQGNDSIAIRSMMNLCLSYDHRIIDGAYAAQFLAHIKRNLETWAADRFLG